MSPTSRRYFIGGSDARIIVGDDEAALLRLWREKRGEVEPEDLSGNLIVQLGLATEDLNRRWASWAHRVLGEKNTLTAADADRVEAAFRAETDTLCAQRH
jgi:predicted phage-related endonuclease